MPTNEVIIGAFYQHDDRKYVLKMESASVPELDNYVFLIEKEKFSKRVCFIDKAWRGSFSDFFAQWTKLDIPNPARQTEPQDGDDWVDCWNCRGTGYDGHDCGEDTCCCLDPEPNVVCHVCHGKGGWKPKNSTERTPHAQT